MEWGSNLNQCDINNKLQLYFNYSLSYLQKKTTKKCNKVRLMFKALIKSQRDTPHIFHCLPHTRILEYWFMYQTSSIMRCRVLPAPQTCALSNRIECLFDSCNNGSALMTSSKLWLWPPGHDYRMSNSSFVIF